MRKLDSEGYNFIATVEGYKSKPYQDSNKIWTIGYGFTFYENGVRVTKHDPEMNRSEANRMLKKIADKFAREADSLIKSNVNQHQFNALTSFAYNVGSDIDADTIPEGLGDSTLLKKVNANPNDTTIPLEFAKWNKSGGKVVEGLINRRKKEITLYNTK